eukprot:TRINITY_DN7816_c0_g3_i1.p1 TRINITY_DN7816_c0_g3~~TRINITY_DN7816_c0_g3_i1.p1  ORF type:complete len:164 (+),score=26.77 TRINITY_DN7816_c0_g3_i1:61-552(+)
MKSRSRTRWGSYGKPQVKRFKSDKQETEDSALRQIIYHRPNYRKNKETLFKNLLEKHVSLMLANSELLENEVRILSDVEHGTSTTDDYVSELELIVSSKIDSLDNILSLIDIYKKNTQMRPLPQASTPKTPLKTKSPTPKNSITPRKSPMSTMSQSKGKKPFV